MMMVVMVLSGCGDGVSLAGDCWCDGDDDAGGVTVSGGGGGSGGSYADSGSHDTFVIIPN